MGSSSSLSDSAKIFREWVEYVSSKGIAFPEVVVAQIVHETDFFSSKVFKENNNLFGMKENGRGYCQGSKNGHAFYVSKEQSIKDYRAYQNRLLFAAARHDKYPKNNQEYMALLEDLPQFWPKRNVRYATDPNYVSSLHKRLAILNTI